MELLYSNFIGISINGETIEQVQCFKYLGVIIDQKLLFKEHMSVCVRNAYHKLYLVNKIREFIPVNTAIVLYKTMILPYLEFGNVFLLNCKSGDLVKIQRVQNRCLRTLLHKGRMYDINLLHRDARLATWKKRALTSAMKLMFKYKFDHNNLAEVRAETIAVTRSQAGPLFSLDMPNSQRFVNCTSYYLRTEWNKLPLSLRCINDYIHFSMAVKRHFSDILVAEMLVVV